MRRLLLALITSLGFSLPAQAQQIYTQPELDALLAPIALYPDALLAFGAHRSPLAALASDHLPVKAIIAVREARANPLSSSAPSASVTSLPRRPTSPPPQSSAAAGGRTRQE